MRRHLFVFIIIVSALAPFCLFSKDKTVCTTKDRLIEAAVSKRQWTGVAVSAEGRIFVNYPLWKGKSIPFSVAELKNNIVKPYPDEEWNTWKPEMSSAPAHFVCVQSVYCDDNDYLWVLDPANPRFEGVIPGAAKLVKIDLKTDEIVQKYYFDEKIAPEACYLNDVRIDTKNKFAYITDSGLGGIIVLDLKTGESRRLLANHSSARSEDITLTINGKKWLRPDGSRPQVHSDGIALSPDGVYLYYQALTGRNLYRIKTEFLRNPDYTIEEIADAVELMGKTGAADGIMFGQDGKLYLSSIENNAIKTFDPATKKVKTIVKDPRILWPDSFACGPDGFMYFTTSRIHEGDRPSGAYRIYKIR